MKPNSASTDAAARDAGPVPLTAQQRRFMVLLQRLLRESGGVGPSYEQLRIGMGLKSRSGIARLADACVERGRVGRLAGTVRSLRVILPVEEDAPGSVDAADAGIRAFSDADILCEAARRGLVRV